MTDSEHGFFGSLLRRGLCSAPFFLIGIGLLFKAAGGGGSLFVFTLVCYGATFLLVGAIVIAPVFTGVIADTLAGGLFTPSGGRPHFPPYSLPESLVKKGRYDEAIEGFRKIADQFPEDLRPWLEMINVAVRYQRDADKAFEFYSDARGRFTHPADRQRLLENYKALKSLDGERPAWMQPSTTTVDAAGAMAQDGGGGAPPSPAVSGVQISAPGFFPEDTGGDNDAANDPQRRRIQFRTYDHEIKAPPKGYLKANEDSLAKAPPCTRSGSDVVDNPESTTLRARINFSPEELAAKMAEREKHRKDAAEVSRKANQAANRRTRIAFAPTPRDDSPELPGAGGQ